MNDLYEKLIKKAAARKQKDQSENRRESELLQIRDERTIPKLRIKFKGKRKGKWKKQ